MPRKFIKRWLPDADTLRKTPGLKSLGHVLDDPHLFHLSRRSVAVAFLVGLFFCYIPTPGQAFLAAFGALVLRGNLPIAVALVWVSNPFTLPFFVLSAYGAGAFVLGGGAIELPESITWAWFKTIWQPFLLGSVIMGLVAGLAGYGAINLIWRVSVARRWVRRMRERAQ
ncbi:MAG TPA: DUF2062 domain-containing protein [Cellvibrionaceae bacterium]|nr:DUF2062 domain-containing protein [Cellvibrionaceae bacterium]HMW71665.1 DUF2062 domain-containing protein [Cellvibrionaceae bacterium]HMY39511.1 DUF2062 domain-containing protein [Marinagarivorans sp.]HNG60713.1 DUF2062 domain-containing protein [Cellvibrionaceae bacterium]